MYICEWNQIGRGGEKKKEGRWGQGGGVWFLRMASAFPLPILPFPPPFPQLRLRLRPPSRPPLLLLLHLQPLNLHFPALVHAPNIPIRVSAEEAAAAQHAAGGDGVADGDRSRGSWGLGDQGLGLGVGGGGECCGVLFLPLGRAEHHAAVEAECSAAGLVGRAREGHASLGDDADVFPSFALLGGAAVVHDVPLLARKDCVVSA